jgi:hypothetical protein
MLAFFKISQGDIRENERSIMPENRYFNKKIPYFSFTAIGA